MYDDPRNKTYNHVCEPAGKKSLWHLSYWSVDLDLAVPILDLSMLSIFFYHWSLLKVLKNMNLNKAFDLLLFLAKKVQFVI